MLHLAWRLDEGSVFRDDAGGREQTFLYNDRQYATVPDLLIGQSPIFSGLGRFFLSFFCVVHTVRTQGGVWTRRVKECVALGAGWRRDWLVGVVFLRSGVVIVLARIKSCF